MSRMTKFLRQECEVEKAVRDFNGKTTLSIYGDIEYAAPVTTKCRREKHVSDIQTSNGAIVKASTRYYLDESIEILVDDRIDGHVVLNCEEYVDQFGFCVGYEVYV